MSTTLNTYVSPTLVGSGTSFAQLQAGGLAAMVARMLALNPAIANPTVALTANATAGGASGGLLAAGAYFFSYTWVNGFGETTPGASEIASALTIAATNIPRVTIPALPTGVSSANIYVTAAGGASGTETLYATGVTTTTFDLAFAVGSNPLAAPPAVNGTGSANVTNLVRSELLARSPLRSSLEDLLTDFLRGDPVSRADVRVKIQHRATAYKVFQALADEIGVLLSASPGTLATVYNAGTGAPSVTRTWP